VALLGARNLLFREHVHRHRVACRRLLHLRPPALCQSAADGCRRFRALTGNGSNPTERHSRAETPDRVTPPYAMAVQPGARCALRFFDP
jgi:hypothetical protein